MAKRRLYSYRITLRDVGLDADPAFRAAPPSAQAEVLRWLVVIAHREKDRELAAGLDRRGRPLKPIKESTRRNRTSEMGPADPAAPPLMPAYAASRTRLLLTGAPTEDGRAVEFWWEYDAHTGDSWGKILDYHRKGIGRSKTKRDVIGISPAAVARVRDDIQERWRQYQRNGFAAPPAGRPTPPRPAPRLVATGRTDWHNFTFGIGGGGPPAPGVQTTGFRQRRAPVQ